jgi:TonB family protein
MTLWDVTAYALQLAALAAVAIAATWALRIRTPRHSLRFWQAVIMVALLLPFAQPRGGDPSAAVMLIRSTTEAAVSATARVTNAPQIQTAQFAFLLIGVGIALRLVWLLAGLLRLRSLVAAAQPCGADLGSTQQEIQATLRVAAEVLITDDLDGPATIGVRRPVVLLPRRVVAMSAAVQRAILYHELLHVKRRDWLQTIAEELWCAVLWFHPLARAIASRLSLAREMVVDEATILATRDRRAYAEALLAFSNPQPHVIGVTPFIGRRTLSQRISLIAEEGRMSRHRAMFSAAVALTASLGMTAVAVDRLPMFVTLQAQSKVYRPGDGVSLPVVVKEVKPAYTAAAMQARIQGSVWLECVVTENGDVSDIKITKSLDTEHGLDQAAIDAAQKWKFKPGVLKGKAVAVAITLELTFTLKK